MTLCFIYQAGERILFSRDDTRVTMHIEIVYAGDPTSFGWILPLARVPTAPDGSDLPLDGWFRSQAKASSTRFRT